MNVIRQSYEEQQYARFGTRASELQRRIAELPDDDSSLPHVAELFRGEAWEVFRLLDEKPGRFSGYLKGHWFRLLRRTRNHPVHGKALFRNLSSN